MEQGHLTKQQILAELVRSPHSALNDYLEVGRRAASQDPEFVAHLISHQSATGNIRDFNIALPIITLSVPDFSDDELVENSLAHLAKLTPRELLSAYQFARGYIREKSVVPNPDPAKAKRWKTVKLGGWKRYPIPTGMRRTVRTLLGPSQRMGALNRLVSRYLKSREDNPAVFQRNLLNFRRSLVLLYGYTHTPMSGLAKSIIMDKLPPADSALEAIQHLDRLEPLEAASVIKEHRLPFLSLFPILKKKITHPLVLMAVIDTMSPTDLQTQMAKLEKLGVKDHAETRAALEQSLSRLEHSRKTVLKTEKATAAVQDEKIRAKLQGAQEKQLTAQKGINGNWLLLVDASGSMQNVVELGKQVAGTLARFVKDQVMLCFFDDSPRMFDVTGKSLDEIRHICRHVSAGGWTSIGCGLQAAIDKGMDIHGILVLSDGGENRHPIFASVYKRYVQQVGREVPVHYYHLGATTGWDREMEQQGIVLQTTELNGTKVDDYSITNLVQQLRCNRYSIIDEIMESRLLTVDKVLGPVREAVTA